MRKAASGIVVTVLAASILFWANDILQIQAEPETVYIRADGSVYPPSAPIQRVADLYTFTDDVHDSFVVERNNVVVNGAGHKIQGAGIGIGVDISNRNNVTLRNLEVTSFLYGIYLQHSSNNVLTGNTMTNNSYNFAVRGSSADSSEFTHFVDTSNTVDGKTIHFLIGVSDAVIDAQTDAGTVHLVNCNNVTIKDLNLTGNRPGVLLYNTTNSRIENVTAQNNLRGISLYYSSNNTLTGNNVLTNKGYGICLYTSRYNVFSGNVVSSNGGSGIDFSSSKGDVLSGNVVSSNGGSGMDFFSASEGTLTRNTISNNSGCGIRYYYGIRNVLSGNIVSENNDGIWFDSDTFEPCRENVLSGNVVSSNGGLGIRLDGRSSILSSNNVSYNSYGISIYGHSNVFAGNIITNNNRGINFGYAWANVLTGNTMSNNVYGIYVYNSGNNEIFHNNFIDNTKQAHAESEANAWNRWEPPGGNYWSDYNGTDVFSGPWHTVNGSDGISETPYVLNEYNVDNYPLMGRFSEFNITSKYHVQTICNSSISGFQYNGTAIRFNVSGENATAGFCRIHIPAGLMGDSFKVFVGETEVAYRLLPTSNSTHRHIYFTYNHSTREVTVIPEFPSLLALLLFMVASLLADVVCRRKHTLCARVE